MPFTFSKQIVARLSKPLVGQEPATKLIRQTALQQWRLLVTNLVSALAQALTEGATLAVVFLAVELLSAPMNQPFDWSSNAIIRGLPGAVALLSPLSFNVAFLSLLGAAVLLQALKSLAGWVNAVTVAYFTARCKVLITERIHRQILSFSFSCASSYKVGDLLSYAKGGPQVVVGQIRAISNLLTGLFLALAYIIVLIGVSGWLLLAAVFMSGLVALLQRQLLPRIARGSRQLTAIQVGISELVTEDFQGLRLLHTSGQLEASGRCLGKQIAKFEWAFRAQGRRMSIANPLSDLLPIVAIFLIVCFSLFIFEGRDSGILPSLAIFVIALQRLNLRISAVSNTFTSLANNAGGIERLNEILSPKGKSFLRIGGDPFEALESQICFKGVSLQYSSGLSPALSEISFSLPKGQTLALVGPSGAGKSSIADLLAGLYSPTNGKIWIDEIPFDNLDIASWQQHLGVVSQDTFLFNASVAENIAFGSPESSMAQIQAACQTAQAVGFIESLPQGYNTLIGERGYTLSGGQRQRLSLARAILRNPDLLILDEATSALDSQSERLVQEAIENFERSHTVLVIAHRLSTIMNSDQILVIDKGRVVQRGIHASLLDQEGLYKHLWDQQSRSLER